MACNSDRCLCICIIASCCFGFLVVPIIIVLNPLVFVPLATRNAIRFSVTNATLAQFEISDNNNTLRYDLALEITVTKRCNTLKVKYDRIETNGYYGTQRFSNATLNPFVQYASYDQSRTTKPMCEKPDPVNVLRPVFKGQNMIILDATESARFGMEKKTGVYSIVMEMQLRVRVVTDARGIGKNYKTRVGCGLKVQLSTNSGGGAASSFNYTRCNLHYSS